jgi:uncharacterized membrane protein YbhN (UPF0104 family)
MKKIFINYLIALFILIIIFYYKRDELFSLDLKVLINKNFYFFLIFKTLSLFFLSIRWHVICINGGFRSNALYSFLQINLGHFLSFFVPGVFSQDIIKFYFIAKLNKFINKKSILIISIYDRVIGLIAFVSLSILLIVFWSYYSNNLLLLIDYISLFKFKIISVFVLSIFIIFFVLRKSLKKFNLFISQFSKNLFSSFSKIFLLAILGHFLNIVGYSFLILELTELDFIQNTVLISISLFGNLFPFTPSGIGITELLFEHVYSLFENTKGFEIGILIRYYSFLLVLLLTIISTFLYLHYIKIKYEKNTN